MLDYTAEALVDAAIANWDKTVLGALADYLEELNHPAADPLRNRMQYQEPYVVCTYFGTYRHFQRSDWPFSLVYYIITTSAIENIRREAGTWVQFDLVGRKFVTQPNPEIKLTCLLALNQLYNTWNSVKHDA